MTTSGNRIYAPPRRPYYVEAPPYRRTSAGIKVLHLLCHTLNLIGEEAYVTTDSVNPALRTPTITAEVVRRHLEAGVEPIVVYPEVVKGNPRNARSVVRYLLNRAGMIGGALVGTFLGVFLAYGFIGPIAGKLGQVYEQDHQFYMIIRAVLISHLQGNAPQISVEIGRMNVPTIYQPSFKDMETLLQNLPAVA